MPERPRTRRLLRRPVTRCASAAGAPGFTTAACFQCLAGTRDEDKAKAFSAFVKGKYGTTIMAECHTDLTLASAASDKKMREQNDQGSRFPSRIIETGWAGN